jgi:peptide/nickel transport system ATP-binding protein
MQPDSNILLSVNSLTVEFQSGPQTNTAVDGISFEVKKGEVLGIVGESGSGKSITALSINQLIRSIPNAHQDGAILFQNGEVENLTEVTERSLQGIRGRSISMIFQEPMTSLNPVMKCGRQIEEVLEIHQNYEKRERKEQVLELLRQVMIRDVERIYNAYPSEISGGQKQRVMIAMAMACEPQLLIADEPTTALDVTIQRTIIDLMRDLQQRTGMSIIVSSHA